MVSVPVKTQKLHDQIRILAQEDLACGPILRFLFFDAHREPVVVGCKAIAIVESAQYRAHIAVAMHENRPCEVTRRTDLNVDLSKSLGILSLTLKRDSK
jgi:hypothetical protein